MLLVLTHVHFGGVTRALVPQLHVGSQFEYPSSDEETIDDQPGAQRRRYPWREDHIELLLDQALEATFPASDPVALALTRTRPLR
jgi:hypothetical protein